MMIKTIVFATLVVGVSLAGCASTPTMPASPISTSALPGAQKSATKPGKPVNAAKTTRLYVWAGFKEKDCSPITPKMGISQAPTKGDITFRENESITIQYSASGKCIGQRMTGTGIYYTPKKGQDGDDHFTVTAATSSGQVATRSFRVNIVE